MVVEQYCPAFDRCTLESPINSLHDWGRWTAPVTWNWVSNTPACINRRCIQESISETNDGWIKVAKHGDCGERQKNGERKNAKKSGCQGARQRRRAKKGNYRLPARALITIQGVKLWRQFGVKTITKTNSRTKNWFLCRMNSLLLGQNDTYQEPMVIGSCTYPLDLFWFLRGSTPVITLAREKIYSWESNRLSLNESVIQLDPQLLKMSVLSSSQTSNQPVTR